MYFLFSFLFYLYSSHTFMQSISPEVYTYYSNKEDDPIIEWRTCPRTKKRFALFWSDTTFFEKISPTIWWVKHHIPFPTLSPHARLIRRTAWRNIKYLYKNTCALTWASIISSYAPEKWYTVYDHTARNSDQRSALDYWRDIDFQRPFFEQFNDLYTQVPKSNVEIYYSQNCDYANYINNSKSCYLCFWSWFLEDSLYCNWTYYGKDLVDCSYCTKGERSYNNHNCYSFYDCKHCMHSTNIQSCDHCFDCTDCEFCFWCVWLQWKKYCILNTQYTKSEYTQKREKIEHLSYSAIKKLIEPLLQNHIHAATRTHMSENTYWNDLTNCSDSFFCFVADQLERCKYNRKALHQKDAYDTYCSGYTELWYEIMWWWYYNKVWFNVLSDSVTNAWYCIRASWGENLFGCVATKNTSNTILNKVYPKHEYEELVSKLIDHMRETRERGEFFPIKHSPYWYNESIAMDYLTINKQQAQKLWLSRYDGVERPPTNVTPTENIIICSQTQKPFKIGAKENKFYEKNNIQSPSLHPFVRYEQRIKNTSNNLHLRTCDKTWEKMLSVYPQKAPFKVYSQQAYAQEMYW